MIQSKVLRAVGVGAMCFGSQRNIVRAGRQGEGVGSGVLQEQEL